MNPTEPRQQAAIHRHSGYVAFLDVLGFRALVSGLDSEKRLENYIDTIDQAVQAAGGSVLEYVIFSDSVIVTSRQDGEAAFESIVEACATLFAKFLQSGIAIRGAIAHGSFTRSSKPNGAFVAGRPIVEAYDYEQRQNWAGILVCPSVVEGLPALGAKCMIPMGELRDAGFDFNRLHLPALVWAYEDIPFKGEPASSTGPGNYEGYAVLPTGEGVGPRNILEKFDEATQALGRLKMRAPDPKAQAKYNAASKLLDKAKGDWQRAVLQLRERPDWGERNP